MEREQTSPDRPTLPRPLDKQQSPAAEGRMSFLAKFTKTTRYLQGGTKKLNWTPSIDHTDEVYTRSKWEGSLPDRRGDHLHTTREKSRKEVLRQNGKQHEDEREKVTNLMTLKLKCQKTPQRKQKDKFRSGKALTVNIRNIYKLLKSVRKRQLKKDGQKTRTGFKKKKKEYMSILYQCAMPGYAYQTT